MGALKDIVDLVTQLSTSVNDRKVAAEIREIQSMIGNLQSEHVTLHEQRIELMTENAELKNTNATQLQEINKLKQEIASLKNQKNNIDQDIQDEAKNILILLTKHEEPTARQIAHLTSIDLPRVEYWLGLLEEKEMVGYPMIMDEETGYYITQKGRSFLFNNNLI